MPVCGWTSLYETTNVTDKDLLELIELSGPKYVVREHKIVQKRLFRKPIEKIEYRVYYRYMGADKEDTQDITLPPYDYNSTYAYFLGHVNGLEEQHKKLSD